MADGLNMDPIGLITKQQLDQIITYIENSSDEDFALGYCKMSDVTDLTSKDITEIKELSGIFDDEEDDEEDW